MVIGLVNQYSPSLIKIGHAEVDQVLDEAGAALEDHGIMVDQGWQTAIIMDVMTRGTMRGYRGRDRSRRRGMWRDMGLLTLRHIQGMLTSHRLCQLVVGIVDMAMAEETHMPQIPMDMAEVEAMGLTFQLMVSAFYLLHRLYFRQVVRRLCASGTT